MVHTLLLPGGGGPSCAAPVLSFSLVLWWWSHVAVLMRLFGACALLGTHAGCHRSAGGRACASPAHAVSMKGRPCFSMAATTSPCT
jgi:hypothetical protein